VNLEPQYIQKPVIFFQMVYLKTKSELRGQKSMFRHCILLTEKNDTWLKSHVMRSDTYGSKSELINYLIRKTRIAENIDRTIYRAESTALLRNLQNQCCKSPKQRCRDKLFTRQKPG